MPKKSSGFPQHYEVLNFRGHPAVEAEGILADGSWGEAKNTPPKILERVMESFGLEDRHRRSVRE